MAYIDTKYLGKCETCRLITSGGCNTYCDHGEEYSPNISKIPVADVVPKSEVERLNAELEACEKHAAIEALKEVWRDLRSMCDAPHWCVWLSEIDNYFEKKTGVKTEDIAELKKKYTERDT